MVRGKIFLNFDMLHDTCGFFYCEQVMNKPKILPLKSVTLEKIENMQKQVIKITAPYMGMHIRISPLKAQDFMNQEKKSMTGGKK